MKTAKCPECGLELPAENGRVAMHYDAPGSDRYCKGSLLDVAQDGSVSDGVNHPSHYNKGKIEVIEYIFDQGWGPGFCIGNCIKYLSRADHKGDKIKDLQKARWYLDYYIKWLESQKGESS